MKLENKIAIVTGSGRSIGKILALALAKEGATVITVGRNKVEIEETTQLIKKTGGKSVSIRADLTKEKDVKKMVEIVLNKYRHIDILVNNVGIVTDRIL